MDSTRRFCPPIPPNPRGAAASAGHRRAHSETFLQLPDDFLLDSDPDFGISDIDFPSLSDESLSVSGAGAAPPTASGYDPHFSAPDRAGQHHGRSLSVDAAFFDGLCAPAQDSRETRHRRSGSMDGYTSPFEGESALDSSDYAKKAMAADKLAEISLMDPKRAKRILANRQSAARSKERKIRYTSELERKVQMLQTEATTLSVQVTGLQKDTTGLTAENRELKLRLQAMEQQAHLREALNDALRGEVQRLKFERSQFPNNGTIQQSGPNFFSQQQQQQQRSLNLGGRQSQQLHASPSHTSSNGPSISDLSLDDSMDFM